MISALLKREEYLDVDGLPTRELIEEKGRFNRI
jgi:hypothetical protein